MRTARTLLVLAGLAAMAYGVVGAAHDPATDALGQVAFLAAVVVAHDWFLMPLILAAGFLVSRYVPVPVRRPVRVALLVSLAVSLMALPFVLGYGRLPDNPSALPRHYGRGLGIVLGVVWGLAVLWALATLVPTRRDSRRTTGGDATGGPATDGPATGGSGEPR